MWLAQNSDLSRVSRGGVLTFRNPEARIPFRVEVNRSAHAVTDRGLLKFKRDGLERRRGFQ